jgi:hypothetical protein
MLPIARIPHAVAVPALLLTFVVCGFVSLSGDSATFDETAHIGAGVSYVETGDFRLNPEHPPLAKMLAALPLQALERGGGRYDTTAWKIGGQWRFGFDLLNRDGAPARRLIPARSAILALGTLLALIVYFWSRELFGRSASLLALAMAVTCPTILAHARLVTTDAPAALGFTATLWLAWRWLTKPSWPRAACVGAALGVALLFKFSCLLLVPVVAGLTAAAVFTGRIDAKRAAGGLALAAALAYSSVWAGYGFRFAASPGDGRFPQWNALTDGGNAGTLTGLARSFRLMPEAYLFGLEYAKTEAVDRIAFLDGELSPQGWYRFFPEAFLLKTPLAFTVLLVWVVTAALRRTRGLSFDGWCVAAAPVALTGLAIVSRFNIGHRHLTPVYPFLCIAIAPAADWLERRGVRMLAVVALVVSCFVSFVVATPGYLSYFNIVAGGPRGGAKHLVDSNLDWGQDLGRLARWMRAHDVAQIDLAYFGTADPHAYGIDFRKVLLFLDWYPDAPASRPGTGRYLAVSATLLAGVYLDADRAFAGESLRRGWVPRAAIDEFLAVPASQRPTFPDWLISRGLITHDQRLSVDDALPSSWITHIRDTQRPIAWAGDSIAIYRVE